MREREVSVFISVLFLIRAREREGREGSRFFLLSGYENYLIGNEGLYNAVACFYPSSFQWGPPGPTIDHQDMKEGDGDGKVWMWITVE